MNKKKIKELLGTLTDGILSETIDFPDGSILALPDSTTMFTKKRLELMETIKTRHPQSVQDLARMTKRAKQAVTRDLKVLERFEVVKLERKGRTSIPTIQREIILFSFPRSNSSLLEEKTVVGAVS